MKSKLFFLTVSFVLLSFFAGATGPGLGENNNKKTDLAGGVIHAETKKPLSNVSVVAYKANKKERTVVTDSHGSFSFEDLKPGTYKFVFEKEGYRKVIRDKVVIRRDEGCEMNVELNEEGGFQMMPGLLFTDVE